MRLNTPIDKASAEGVLAGEDWLKAATRVWTAGVEASPLVRGLPGKHDAAGRSHVGEHLTLPEHPEVYVLGDAGVYTDPRLGPLPPTASVAVQQGPWAARDLKRRLRGAGSKRGRPPFRFFDRGYVVSLGPESAVADALGLRLRGPAAQALYRSVLLYYMKSRRDRILTGADWAMERTLGRLGFEQPTSSARADVLTSLSTPNWRQVALYYSGHVIGCYAGIPDVVGVDEDDGTFLVAAGADVAENGGRCYAAQLHLFAERLEQFASPLRAAASLARSGANEDLAQLAHIQIL